MLKWVKTPDKIWSIQKKFVSLHHKRNNIINNINL